MQRFSAESMQRIAAAVRAHERDSQLDPLRRARWFRGPEDPLEIPFTPSADVPAYGVMEITGADVEAHLCTVATAAVATTGAVVVNGPWPVNSGNFGRAAFGLIEPIPALYDTADGTPAAGEMWGPSRTTSWKLGKGLAGFRVLCLDPDTTGVVWVLRVEEETRIRFVLRTDMEPGQPARAEILTLAADGSQVATGVYCTVFDWACEFYGIADEAWGEAIHRADTPDLAIEEGDVTYETLRMTCPGFAGCGGT